MTSVELITEHILAHLARKKPLFVALQGPQGSGKSYLTSKTYTRLSTLGLRVAVLSIDDIYLPHADLRALALAHPKNPLWRGRGQPGTHDVTLGVALLSALREGTRDVEIPRFEKSLFDGEGDRLPMDGSGVVVNPPHVDVVIMEGWCMGFHPIEDEELEERWRGVWSRERQRLGLGADDVIGRKVDILAVNEKLKQYVEMWRFFDVFVQIKPAPLPTSSPHSIIYKWRLEQEHNMKAANGGKGMSDDAVKSFVDRYIPGYVFFGDGVTSSSLTSSYGSPTWIGRSLTLFVNDERQVIDVGKF